MSAVDKKQNPKGKVQASGLFSLVAVFSKTKLFWGLALLLLIGIVTSPISSGGRNIFLSFGNLTDVLRQVSVTGIVAVGMTVVILIAGIDLSVGSIMALGTVVCAMLLTQEGWTAASYFGVPAAGLIIFLFSMFLFGFAARAAGFLPSPRQSSTPRDGVTNGVIVFVAAAVALFVMFWGAGQVDSKFGVIGVLIIVPCVGAIMGGLNGVIIVAGRAQPFIVTLAMMVGVLGLARVMAGQDTAVYPVYTGTNATEEFEVLRTLLWDTIPVPGVIFLATLLVFYFLTRLTTYGGYLRAIGGNEEASRLAGVDVGKVKIVTYAISGFLAALAGVLYVAQFRQGKPDAGVGLELDAIAAVVIGGTSLMGGKGTIIGTMVGVLIFGFLGNILQLNNIDSNTQLIMKGVIIILAVLLQEGQLNAFFVRLRPYLSLGKRL